MNTAASPTSEMTASSVPALTDSRSRCLIWSGLVPGNIRDASLTVTSSLNRLTPVPHVYRQVTEPAGSSALETPSATLAFATCPTSSTVSNAHAFGVWAETVLTRPGLAAPVTTSASPRPTRDATREMLIMVPLADEATPHGQRDPNRQR